MALLLEAATPGAVNGFCGSLAAWLSRGPQLQVLRPVVIPDPVPMVNVLTGAERPAEGRGHDESVLREVSAGVRGGERVALFNIYLNVAILPDNSPISAVNGPLLNGVSDGKAKRVALERPTLRVGPLRKWRCLAAAALADSGRDLFGTRNIEMVLRANRAVTVEESRRTVEMPSLWRDTSAAAARADQVGGWLGKRPDCVSPDKSGRAITTLCVVDGPSTTARTEHLEHCTPEYGTVV